MIEPVQWKDVENDFVFNSMAYDSKFLPADKKCFVFPIPKPVTTTIEPSKISSPPAGWRRIDKRFLIEKKSAYRASDLADFFDGGLPDWGKAQSDDIPKRWIVQKLLDDLRIAGEQKNDVCFRVLLGAGGEGKIQTDLGLAPAEGDSVYNYDTATGSYKLAVFEFGEWDPAEPTVAVGEGVWVRKVAAGAWTRTFSVNP